MPLWIKDGKLVVEDGRLKVCDDCPCGSTCPEDCGDDDPTMLVSVTSASGPGNGEGGLCCDNTDPESPPFDCIPCDTCPELEGDYELEFVGCQFYQLVGGPNGYMSISYCSDGPGCPNITLTWDLSGVVPACGNVYSFLGGFSSIDIPDISLCGGGSINVDIYGVCADPSGEGSTIGIVCTLTLEISFP